MCDSGTEELEGTPLMLSLRNVGTALLSPSTFYTNVTVKVTITPHKLWSFELSIKYRHKLQHKSDEIL